MNPLETNSKPIPAYAYLRVSTAEQAKHGISLEAQQARIEAYCKLQGLQLVKMFTDAGVSGSKRLETRPAGGELNKLLYQLRQAKGTTHVAVVAVKLDRLFRRTIDCLTTYDEWRSRGIAIHLADEGGNCIDTSTAVGAMFLTMRAMSAQFERDMTAERTAVAMTQKRARSEVQSGRIPYGWIDAGKEPHPTRLREDGSRLMIRKLVRSEPEQEVITAIMELAARGVSYHHIAVGLNQQGIPTKLGRGDWQRSQIKAIYDRMMRDRRLQQNETQPQTAAVGA